jgi:hypothetical protein
MIASLSMFVAMLIIRTMFARHAQWSMLWAEGSSRGGLRDQDRVTVVVVTRTVRGIPTEVRVGPSEGLPGVGVASADELVMIPRTTLRDRIATLSRGKLDEIDAALRFSLGFEA